MAKRWNVTYNDGVQILLQLPVYSFSSLKTSSERLSGRKSNLVEEGFFSSFASGGSSRKVFFYFLGDLLWEKLFCYDFSVALICTHTFKFGVQSRMCTI